MFLLNTLGKDIASDLGSVRTPYFEYMMMSPLPQPIRFASTLTKALCCLMIALLCSACADFASDSEGFGAFSDENNVSSEPGLYQDQYGLAQAQEALKRHDVRAAQSIYNDILLSSDPSLNPSAAVGKALTDLMLLSDDASVRAFLTQQLKAERPSFDTQRLIWAEEGMLSWFSSNVSWERSSPSAVGVRTLVAEHMPWENERLDSWDAFVRPLQVTGNDLIDQALLMNIALASIEDSLSLAIDHPDFAFYYLPSEVLFGKDDANLGVVLGKVELLLLRSALQGVRASIELLAAYDHPWTLVKLSSEEYWGMVAQDPDHPDHDTSLRGAAAHHAAYINRTFMRGMRASESLERASDAARGSLMDLREAAERASTVQPDRFTFEWDKADARNLLAAQDTAQALLNAFDGMTQVPPLSPEVSVDMNALFSPNTLSLDAEIPWVIASDGGSWEPTVQAEEAILERFVVGTLDGAEWVVDGVPMELPLDKPLAPWVERFLDVYEGY